jgi:hypothetical protein
MHTKSRRKRARRPLGVILYQGPSRIDGKPIVLIATLNSRNKKTGNMIQTWILRRDVSPIAAINTGADESICGYCPLRGIVMQLARRKGKRAKVNKKRGCYVAVAQAPLSIYGAFKRGRYEHYDKERHAKYFEGRSLRLGAYGDPVAVPLPAWKRVLPLVVGRTGYSHQWREIKFQRWSKYIMASTHSIDENEQARRLGWRSFRTRTADQPIADDEIICPASDEAGKRLTCGTCFACKGGRPQQRSIVIIGHGSRSILGSVNRVSMN